MSLFETTVCPWKNNAKAALTLTLDGAYAETYERAMEVLLSYEMPATWFVVTGSVGGELEGRPVITWENLQRASLRGMEIASHTVTHPDLALSWAWIFRRYVRPQMKKAHRLFTSRGLAKALFFLPIFYKLSRGVGMKKVLEEALKSKKVIERALGPCQVLSFAYPGGRYDPSLMQRLKESGYLSARSVDPGYNSTDSTDLFALKSQLWDIRMRATRANQWVDYALEHGRWLIETYHVISQYGTTGYYWDTSVSDFDRHLSYVRSRGLWVDTQERITKYLLERRATRITLKTVSENGVLLYPETSLDPNTFNQPLSLKTNIPPEWDKVRMAQADMFQVVSPEKERDGWTVTYDILPHRGTVSLSPI